MSRRLDSFPSALREYDTVPAEPSAPAESTGRLHVTGIDVRRFKTPEVGRRGPSDALPEAARDVPIAASR